LLAERFELGRFLGRTLLYGADVPEDFLNKRSAGVLKALTGGDPVTVEFKNSNEQPELTCQFNVIITSNSRLTVHLEGDTDAWRRRLAIVSYTQPKPAKVIPDLSERILRQEGAGVLNWMLEGLAQLRAADWQLHLSKRQQDRVDDLLLESDSHGQFARRCLVKDGNGTLTLTDAFGAYVEFCNENGWAAISRNRFGRLMPDVVVQQLSAAIRRDIKDTAGKQQQGWKGIRLLSLSERDHGNASEPSAAGSGEAHAETSEGFFPVVAPTKRNELVTEMV
jgi:phage/plasmid-associated DNA primase